jgi:CBS domain-containing protein
VASTVTQPVAILGGMPAVAPLPEEYDMRYVENFAKKVVTVTPEDSLQTVARVMEERNVGAVVVVEQGTPVGIVTDRDLALELGVRGTSLRAPVVRVMATPVETIGNKEGVFAATGAMRDANVRRLVVVDDDGRLVGIVTLDDLLRLLSRELANLVEGISPEMQVI